jgi:hypothetical protein
MVRAMRPPKKIVIAMKTKATLLRILYAIGGSEVAHFQTWHDKAGNAPSLTDNTPGFPPVTFPDLNSPPFGGEAFSTNLIMPEPCDFISEDLGTFPRLSSRSTRCQHRMRLPLYAHGEGRSHFLRIKLGCSENCMRQGPADRLGQKIDGALKRSFSLIWTPRLT